MDVLSVIDEKKIGKAEYQPTTLLLDNRYNNYLSISLCMYSH